MLELSNINIAYASPVIENGSITIPNGKITAVTGRSGSGKSSVLYLLGLISSNYSYTYNYNGQILDFKDSETVNKLRREQFGFLLQDNSLLENLTVYNNIEFNAHLAGFEMDKEKAIELMQYVDLPETLLECFPKQLSGGEQQRAALAAILAKKPSYILADEPTSALDSENTNHIIDLLKRLVKDGTTVVLATHSDTLCAAADVVYHIENCGFKLVRGEVNVSKGEAQGVEFHSDLSSERVHVFSWKNRLEYVFRSQQRGKTLKRIVTLFCALGIAGFAIMSSILSYLKSSQRETLEKISDREIFLCNLNNEDSQGVWKDTNPALSQSTLDRLSSNSRIEAIIEYCNLTSNYYYLYNIETGLVDVASSSEISLSVNEDRSTTDFTDIISVVPYTASQKLDKQLSKEFSQQSGVFISPALAEKMGISSLNEDDRISIQLTVGVPVVSISDEELGQFSGCLEKELDLTVNGIMNSSYLCSYSATGNFVIYIPDEVFSDILSEQQKILEKAIETQGEGVLASYASLWNPSAVLIYTKSYEDVPYVTSYLESGELEGNLKVVAKYQDISELDSLVNRLSNAILIVVIIVTLIVFVLMCSLFVSTTNARKREIALLKADGFDTKQLLKLMFVESVVQGMEIVIDAVLVAVLFFLIGSVVILSQISVFSLNVLIYIVIMAFSFVLIPSMISVTVSAKVQPADVLRN